MKKPNNLNQEIIKEFREKVEILFERMSKADKSLNEPAFYELIQQALNKKDEEFVKMCEEILKTKFDDLGMGSLDYHEKCAIDAFKEYIKHRYINKIKGG